VSNPPNLKPILDKDKNYKKGDSFEVSYSFEIGSGIAFYWNEISCRTPLALYCWLKRGDYKTEEGETWLIQLFPYSMLKNN